MIKLGGSHLVCLNFFKLEALGGDFASKAREVMARLSRGEEVLVVEGADDVCAACPASRTVSAATQRGWPQGMRTPIRAGPQAELQGWAGPG